MVSNASCVSSVQTNSGLLLRDWVWASELRHGLESGAPAETFVVLRYPTWALAWSFTALGWGGGAQIWVDGMPTCSDLVGFLQEI